LLYRVAFDGFTSPRARAPVARSDANGDSSQKCALTSRMNSVELIECDDEDLLDGIIDLGLGHSQVVYGSPNHRVEIRHEHAHAFVFVDGQGRGGRRLVLDG
jgi:hypothetical protein